MIFLFMRILFFTFILFILTALHTSKAEIINEIEIRNNDRITKETIKTYGLIELGKNYELNDLNQIFKNLYETNFFETLEINIENNKLIIDVKEIKIIQSVSVQGVKSNKLNEMILKNVFSKDKAPFLITKVKEDVDKIKISLNSIGYYFADVKTKTLDNSNNTIDLVFQINLGEKAKNF